MNREQMIQRAAAVRRLWRPRDIPRVVVPLVLAVIALSINPHQDLLPSLDHSPYHGPLNTALHDGLVLVAALLLVYTVRAFIQGLNDILDDYLGLARARSVATFTSVILYAIIVLIAITAVGTDLSGVLVGGAVTGVIVGIAAQTSLANIIAGLVILFARPYNAGMYVTTRAATFGGVEYSGQVWDISLFYTTLHNNMLDLEVRIPNSAMINAVVVRRPAEHEVYLPVTLPKTTEDVPAILERLRAAIVERMKGEATPHVTLESITDVGYVVGVRAFVANPDDRQVIETAVARVMQDVVRATTPPPSADLPAVQHGAAPDGAVEAAAGNVEAAAGNSDRARAAAHAS